MFAVLKSHSSDVAEGYSYCCHLGTEKSANDFLEGRKTLSSAGVYRLVEVDRLEELAEQILPDVAKTEEEDILGGVLEKLEELASPATAEKFARQIEEQAGKVVAEVRSMGIAGMQAVGDGFIALGDLIKKSSEE